MDDGFIAGLFCGCLATAFTILFVIMMASSAGSMQHDVGWDQSVCMTRTTVWGSETHCWKSNEIMSTMLKAGK